MEKKEFKVGEVFQYENIKIEVEMDLKSSCEHCYFYKNTKCNVFNKIMSNIVGPCESYERTDNTNVIFVKVED